MVKDNIIDTDNKKKEKIKEFSDLLDSLEATADKKAFVERIIPECR